MEKEKKLKEMLQLAKALHISICKKYKTFNKRPKYPNG